MKPPALLKGGENRSPVLVVMAPVFNLLQLSRL